MKKIINTILLVGSTSLWGFSQSVSADASSSTLHSRLKLPYDSVSAEEESDVEREEATYSDANDDGSNTNVSKKEMRRAKNSEAK